MDMSVLAPAWHNFNEQNKSIKMLSAYNNPTKYGVLIKNVTRQILPRLVLNFYHYEEMLNIKF